MRPYWITFVDGTKACCEGSHPYDARRIAERIAGKPVAGTAVFTDDDPNVVPLPYPASPTVWQFEHPVHGRTPTFCFTPEECKGRSRCMRSYACSE